MNQVILVTGANGMLARQLASHLEPSNEVRFLSRRKTRSNEYVWDLDRQYIDPTALKNVNIIIHLAGASIADKRWTKKRKALILSSRVDTAKLILNELKKQQITIDAFISASAVGYYGAKTVDGMFDEASAKGNDFLSDVCAAWEQAAVNFKSSGAASRVAIVRMGIILAEHGGALTKIINPIKYGLGAALGSGSQYMPWIHIQDLVRIFKFIVDDSRITGTYNAVAPQHITNLEMTKAIAKRMKRPLLLGRAPKFIIKCLFGEMSSILLEGSKISSEKITKTGFKFEYETLSKALDYIFSNK